MQFEKSLIKSMIAQWDPDNTGELDFQKFCAMILDSKNLPFVILVALLAPIRLSVRPILRILAVYMNVARSR